MIWGKTDQERRDEIEEYSRKVHEERHRLRRRFAWIPKRLSNGRCVWLENYYAYIVAHKSERYIYELGENMTVWSWLSPRTLPALSYRDELHIRVDWCSSYYESWSDYIKKTQRRLLEKTGFEYPYAVISLIYDAVDKRLENMKSTLA